MPTFPLDSYNYSVADFPGVYDGTCGVLVGADKNVTLVMDVATGTKHV